MHLILKYTQTLSHIYFMLLVYNCMRSGNCNLTYSYYYPGQFWNNPVSVVPYVAGSGDGPLSPDQSSDNLYTVTVTTSGISRSYVGQYRTITWEHREEPCLYVGDSQASSLGVNLTPNDGVLEGDYTDYIVDTAFSELGPFKFGLFDESSCT